MKMDTLVEDFVAPRKKSIAKSGGYTAMPKIIPPDAMTGEEFKRLVKADLTALYLEHGLI